MIDIKFLRTNPDIVKENIKKKFQDEKIELVDKVIEFDEQCRKAKSEGDDLRNQKNLKSKEFGKYKAIINKSDDEAAKAEAMANVDKLTAEIEEIDKRRAELEEIESKLNEEIRNIMLVIPNIIDDSVPIGKDDSENVEVEKFGEPFVPEFEVPYHVDIMEKVNGIDLDSARKTSGNGFYYLCGDIAQLQSCILSYARDFMIDKGFTYYIPPFMIRSDVVTGVMSFAEMEGMMYKIEGEDLYLIGTSEHSMIGKFI
ncbi:MAG: serine--tRNA ligase, partial [Ruminococcus sp.]|nr:serine--tRNA ligase [Ruminococcus sp.]